MSGIYRCQCGQQFKANIPAGGATVKCPGCGTLLKLDGAADAGPGGCSPGAAGQQFPSSPAPTPQRAGAAPQRAGGDPLFGDLDVPSSPSASFGGGSPLGAPGGGSPMPRRTPGPSGAASSKKGGAGKVVLIALAGLGGVMVLFVVIGLVAAMSARSKDRGVGRTASSSSGAATVSKSSKPVTAEEAKVLAEKFENEIRSGSPVVANQMVNWQGVVDKGLEGFDISATNKSQFARGAVSGMRQRNWAQVIKTQTAGDVSLLRMRTKDGAPTALFRAKTTDGGVGYFEFAFYRNAQDKAGIADVYAFQTGEWMSETIHRAAIPFIAHLNRSFVDKLSGAQSDYVKHQSKIQSMGQLAHSSPQAAMVTYRSLPATLKGDKTIMILRIGIASRMNNDSEYQAAINDFMRKFPNDPAAQLFAIDFYAMKQDMKSTLAAIQKLDQQVGGDPALQVLEAAVHVEEGNMPKAKAALQKALERDPEYQDAKTMLANLG